MVETVWKFFGNRKYILKLTIVAHESCQSNFGITCALYGTQILTTMLGLMLKSFQILILHHWGYPFIYLFFLFCEKLIVAWLIKDTMSFTYLILMFNNVRLPLEWFFGADKFHGGVDVTNWMGISVSKQLVIIAYIVIRSDVMWMLSVGSFMMHCL